jgi:murein DD-endopeptidase MepM/ murein hydrolase activator NlpD
MKTKNIYAVPLKGKARVISDSRLHKDYYKHALDFLVPINTKIYAPKAGKVIQIKVDSTQGGFTQKYNQLKYMNYITIKHANKEFSQFVHLKNKGALVKVNDKVRQGQPIALSGNTGFTSQPHVHFMVFKKNETKIGWESLKIRFKKRVIVKRNL